MNTDFMIRFYDDNIRVYQNHRVYYHPWQNHESFKDSVRWCIKSLEAKIKLLYSLRLSYKTRGMISLEDLLESYSIHCTIQYLKDKFLKTDDE